MPTTLLLDRRSVPIARSGALIHRAVAAPPGDRRHEPVNRLTADPPTVHPVIVHPVIDDAIAGRGELADARPPAALPAPAMQAPRRSRGPRAARHGAPSRRPVLLPVLLLGVSSAVAGVLTLPGETPQSASAAVLAFAGTAPVAGAARDPAAPDLTGLLGTTEAVGGVSQGAVAPPPASLSPLARSRSSAPVLPEPLVNDYGREILGSKAALLAAAVPAAGPPAAGPVTSSFGFRWGRLHAGIDFAVPVGSPVLAVQDGVVHQTSRSRGGYGVLTVLRHTDGTLTYYAHQDDILVTDGQAVTVGEQIGLSGNSGHSTGPHLHFEVRPGGGDAVDPRAWLAQRGIDL